MTRPIITLITDFGLTDSYVAQMKGAILDINPDVCLVDVTHSVPAQNVERAAAILEEIVETYPLNTIHLAVVDPGVGADRPLLAAEIGRWRFIAPDNGLLSEILRRYACSRVIRIQNRRFWRATVSATFHGRDIMAPVAAHWSLGIDVAEFGPVHTEPLVRLPECQAVRHGNSIRGKVLWCDHFGNLITSVLTSQIPRENRDRLVVECGNQRTVGIHEHYAQVDRGCLLALIGSLGRLEIAVREGNARSVLNCGAGEAVSVHELPTPHRNKPTDEKQQIHS